MSVGAALNVGGDVPGDPVPQPLVEQTTLIVDQVSELFDLSLVVIERSGVPTIGFLEHFVCALLVLVPFFVWNHGGALLPVRLVDHLVIAFRTAMEHSTVTLGILFGRIELVGELLNEPDGADLDE
jgi:hypothetical protein